MLPRPMKPIVVRGEVMSEHLENVVDGAFGTAIAGADCDDPVEPVVVRRGGFKRDRGAEIILRRIDVLAGGDLVHDSGGTVPHAAIDHADRGAVVGSQDKANIQRGRSIGTADDPIGTAGENGALEFRPLECAAANEADPAVATGRGSDRL